MQRYLAACSSYITRDRIAGNIAVHRFDDITVYLDRYPEVGELRVPVTGVAYIVGPDIGFLDENFIFPKYPQEVTNQYDFFAEIGIMLTSLYNGGSLVQSVSCSGNGLTYESNFVIYI